MLRGSYDGLHRKAHLGGKNRTFITSPSCRPVRTTVIGQAVTGLRWRPGASFLGAMIELRPKYTRIRRIMGPAPMKRRNQAPGTESGLSDPVGARHMAEVIVQSTIDGVRHRRLFDDVETFCLFIGYPRSGHTLVGALLNAHPEAVVAHGLGVMRYVKLGLRRDQLYSLLLARDQQFGEIGHQWSGYDYDIPGQHQGRWDRLRVIGDKRAASATNRLAGRPSCSIVCGAQ